MRGSHPSKALGVRGCGLALALLFHGVFSACIPLQAQSPRSQEVPHGQDQAPNQPVSAAQAASMMTVPPGFRVEVVASEPDLVNPVAMTFDEKGRIWVTESVEYPRHASGPGRDRIKVLEDTDGDGRADRFTVFAEGLNIPSGIAVGHGGVWVGNAPDILFLQDRDGDGKADTREVVATGFGRSDTHELPNSLTWGPDGWLYGWNGVFNPCRVVSRNGKTYRFTCAIFRIHPKTRVFEIWCEGTSNPWGIAIDPEGSFFSSACVIDHLWHLVETGYYIRQGGPYPPFTWPIESIVDHLHQKAAYCGIHYFDSPAYPAEYRDRLYMGNIHGNSVNVDTIERNGSTYRSKSAPDFLKANDAWFMPVSQKTGPDGCLYVLDWYDRYHCYQDANRDPGGIDRLKGRLYRVRYQESPRRTGFDLGRASDADLIKLLSSANVYDRDTAQRILTERGSRSVHAALEALVMDEQSPRRGRMHALWARVSSGSLDPSFHARLITHADPALRAWGVRAAGEARSVDATVRELVMKSARDSSADVRLQVAIAAGKLTGVDALPLLLEVLMASSGDPLIPRIVWQNLHPVLKDRQRDIVEWLARNSEDGPGFSPLAPHAIEKLLASQEPDAKVIAAFFEQSLWHGECRDCVDLFAERLREGNLAQAVVDGLKRELARVVASARREKGFPNEEVCSILLTYFGIPEGTEATRRLAMKTADRSKQDARGELEELRIRAVEALLHVDPRENAEHLVGMILGEGDQASSVGFRGKVLDLLGSRDDPAMGAVVVKAYAGLAPELKPHAIEFLTERPAWAKQLLDAILAKKIPAQVLNVTQLRRLQRSKDSAIVERVKALFGSIREERNPHRERIVNQVRGLIRSMDGDPFAGQLVFTRLCAQCHKMYGQGQDVGPDLTSNGRNDFDQLLSNVLDPSLVIGPGYQATTVATTDGRVLTGLLTEDGAERIVLKIQGGKLETIPRGQVDEVKTSALSLMPEEIEKQFTPQELVDLFAFLVLDKAPTDPSAKALAGAGRIRRGPKPAAP